MSSVQLKFSQINVLKRQFLINWNRRNKYENKPRKPKVAMRLHALWIGQQVVKLPAVVAKTNL